MAIVVSENFDSYADGDSLNGKTGGSGWTGAWTISGAGPVVSNVLADSGTLSARKTATVYQNALRVHTGIKDVKYTFKVNRVTSVDGNLEVLGLSTTNNFRWRVANDTQWNIDINGVTQTNQNGWSNNTWHKVEIAVNQTLGTLKVSFNNGAEVSYTFTNSGNNFTDFYLIWPSTDSNGGYFDSITLDNDLTFDKDKVAVTTKRLLTMGIGS